MIAVFAYAFAHRKTQDFLVEIALAGHRDVIVIGAPFQKLAATDSTSYFRMIARQPKPLETKDICERLGFRYQEVPHSDIEAIAETVQKYGIKLGIISGARILKRDIIELFSDGIVNFHPGKIPETSGLDAFFYTLKNNVDAGVTTHFVDPRVDAGLFLAFDAVEVQADDTPEDLQQNVYYKQISALRNFLRAYHEGSLSPSVIDRPAKNIPMGTDEKWLTLRSFAQWRTNRIVGQTKNLLFTYCENGNAVEAAKILSQLPDLLESRTSLGWTPLIVAAFNQNEDLVKALLANGADPNASGNKGTTVLMYAKTALLGVENPNFDILDLLLAAGARVNQVDLLGKTVLDYVQHESKLKSYFMAKAN